MVNLIEKGKNMIDKNEKIISEVIVYRVLKNYSTIIFLTNKRIIYFKNGFSFSGFKSINLPEIKGITYLTKPLHSGGLIKLITNKKNILISPSYVGQDEANKFIEQVKKRIK